MLADARQTARLALAFALLSLTLPHALAQRFAFVSTRVPDWYPSTHGRAPQSEVFLYRDGSELRLTHTSHASEYDPAPSPGARYVAFVAHDHSDEEGGWEAWSWYLGVVETLTGREVARWDLPGSVGMLRPAGGFQTAWAGAEAVLAQVPAADGSWEVHRFDVATGEGRSVASGFGVALARGGGRLATTRDDGVHVVDLATGTDELVFAGAAGPLAWWRGGLLVANEAGLVLVDPATGAAEEVHGPAGVVTEVRADPAGAAVAYVLLDPDAQSSEVVVIGDDGVASSVWYEPGWISGLDWLGDGLLAFAVDELTGDTRVQVTDLSGQGFAVSSAGADHSPRGVPAR